MGTGIHRRLYLVWSCALITVSLTRGEKQAAGRKSRQALEREAQEGVWGPWTTWTDCSQSCGVGVSERRRQCLPPPESLRPGGHLPFCRKDSPTTLPSFQPYAPTTPPSTPTHPSLGVAKGHPSSPLR
ncbi:hypothetical protein ANANG_G00007560 [Anguilla anguilla]|uniref:ADAMTS cysteine-rich domain-containing protein n=1 Tax=Anguilla anguilla TaxID=7936 RepID=A0A9D3MW60_ANGAN|nr:hypothetical protein ANANG_G00007560 [Anguilla anguilla]